MNKTQLVGRLGKDPELRYTKTGKAYAYMNIAVDGGYDHAKKEKRTDWIPLVVWGKLAETCAKGLVKGSMIAVVARLSPSSYEKDGKTVYSLEVVVEEVDFLTRPKK